MCPSKEPHLLTFFLAYLPDILVTFFLTYFLKIPSFWPFFLTVFLTFFLTYLLKIPSFWPFFSHSLSDILSDISSEITFFLTFFLTVFLTSFLTYLLKLPSFWPFFSHSLSDIFSEISFFLTCFSHSLSDTSCDKASDMSFWHIFWHYFFHLFWCSVCYSWCHSFWHSFGHLNVVTIAYMKRPEYILHTPLKRGSCLHQWRKAQLQANILNANMFFLIYMVIAHMYICFGVCLKIFLRYLQKLNISGEICRDSTELIFLVPLKHHFFGHDTIGICFFGHPKLVISRNIEHHLNTLKLQVLWTTFLFLMSGARDIFVKHPCFIQVFSLWYVCIAVHGRCSAPCNMNPRVPWQNYPKDPMDIFVTPWKEGPNSVSVQDIPNWKKLCEAQPKQTWKTHRSQGLNLHLPLKKHSKRVFLKSCWSWGISHQNRRWKKHVTNLSRSLNGWHNRFWKLGKT